MSTATTRELNNWIPRRLVGLSSNPTIEWLYTGDKNFTEPFFDDTITACRNLNENRTPFKVLSDLRVMVEWAGNIDALEPSAIIFHVSRCGSTLLSQLLCMDQKNMVLSEVPFFDELLRLPFKKQAIESFEVNNYLSAAIKYYSRKRMGTEAHLFIKTDSWHVQFYIRFRTLLPTVPFILLYRNPFEVMLSHQRQRGIHSVPGIIEPAVFGFSDDLMHIVNPDLYLANVLTGYFSKMIEITRTDPLVLPVNYSEGINQIMKKISVFAGLKITKKTEKLFEERSRFHAKHPHQLFMEQNPSPEPPSYLLPALQLYEQLEGIRLLNY